MSRKIKVYLDTNVLLDVLSKEQRPGSDASNIIFQAIRSGILEGELCTQSFLDGSYIFFRGKNNPLFSEKMLRLMDYINIDSIDSFQIRQALVDSRGDFEDDAQYACAYDGGCDVIITHDQHFIKQYGDKEQFIQFFTPEEFVAKLTGQTSAQEAPA